jgi:hypothetical protein
LYPSSVLPASSTNLQLPKFNTSNMVGSSRPFSLPLSDFDHTPISFLYLLPALYYLGDSFHVHPTIFTFSISCMIRRPRTKHVSRPSVQFCIVGLILLGVTSGLGWVIYTSLNHELKMQERKLATEEKRLQHEQSRDTRPYNNLTPLLTKLGMTEKDLQSKVEQADKLELRTLWPSIIEAKSLRKSSSATDDDEKPNLKDLVVGLKHAIKET